MIYNCIYELYQIWKGIAMEVNSIFLAMAGLLPAIILCVYIFRTDRVEKEPLPLLMKLFFAGALCCFPAAELENIIIGVIDGVFSQIPITKTVYYVYTAFYYFIGVALVEEGLKWIVLYAVTKNNSEFNCLFDGLIYAIFVSLGFAALENIFYVLEYGWINAFMRAVLSVPGHMFFAVMMGYYYSLWHITEKAKETEELFKSKGLIPYSVPGFDCKRYTYLTIAVPILFHGIYNYCCSMGTMAANLVFLGFVIFMYIYCFRKIRLMSEGDAYQTKYVTAMLIGKYPQLKEETQEKEEVLP
ncbi:MAG: PrsW family intramembrane metalloprotease [Clostridia bacterium]|nr:PrsW family intramembrane metalloprotease [Clostridia bacterium]